MAQPSMTRFLRVITGCLLFTGVAANRASGLAKNDVPTVAALLQQLGKLPQKLPLLVPAEPLLQEVPAVVEPLAHVSDAERSRTLRTKLSERAGLPSGAREAPTAPRADAADLSVAGDGGASADPVEGDFDWLRLTVVQFHTVVAEKNILEPYRNKDEVQYVGSGFAVRVAGVDVDSDPVFVTNAHVAEDAREMRVQFPSLGSAQFDVYVPVICQEFDLAIVRLKDPQEVLAALAAAGGSVRPLDVGGGAAQMGAEVAAVGFPLGSTTLKMSRGIISGTELVSLLGGTVCYSSTAPISPGSSGGPLFALEDGQLRFVGVNFAASAEHGAQNQNYVIPAVHVSQVIEAFRQRLAAHEDASGVPLSSFGQAEHQNRSGLQFSAGVHGRPQSRWEEADVLLARLAARGVTARSFDHWQLRIAPVDAVAIESGSVLYANSGGCDKGVFLTRLHPGSALRHADPPVPERSFLVAVEAAALDEFGMGRSPAFMGELLPFESLLVTGRQSFDAPVQVTTCFQGEEQVHNVSMAWDDRYHRRGVLDVREQNIDQGHLDYEVFAGLTVMQMTENHIKQLIKDTHAISLGRWLLPEERAQPRLLITAVEKGTYASTVLSAGQVVVSVNGEPLSTLSDFRAAVKPSPEGYWRLETDKGIVYAVSYRDAVMRQLQESGASQQAHYLATPALVSAADRLLEKGSPAEGVVPVIPLAAEDHAAGSRAATVLSSTSRRAEAPSGGSA